MLRILFFSAVCLSPQWLLAAEPEAIALWAKGAPGSEARMQEAEKKDEGPGKCNVTNIHHPSITPYLPTADKATGTAIIIAPGGGHRMLCLGHEGGALAQWFADHGIAAFVLKYRLAREAESKYTVDEHAMGRYASRDSHGAQPRCRVARPTRSHRHPRFLGWWRTGSAGRYAIR